MAFVREAASSATDDCIVWPYARTTVGYGIVRVDSRNLAAHRVVLELATGPAPSARHDAAHAPVICHNRLCVNPRHLRWATRAQNFADKIVDGTTQRGEQNGHAKLTRDQVRAIRADTRSERAIAADYPVSRATINEIRTRKIWSWLD